MCGHYEERERSVEILGPGMTLTAIGMGVVFGALVGLMAMIRLLHKFAGAPADEVPVRVEAADDMAPVIAAAVCCFLETERRAVYVPPVVRGPVSAWAQSARGGAPRRWRGR